MNEDNTTVFVLLGMGLGIVIGAVIVHIIHTKHYSTSQPEILSPRSPRYKNDEKWKIERDVDGSIKLINVIRDAKTTN